MFFAVTEFSITPDVTPLSPPPLLYATYAARRSYADFLRHATMLLIIAAADFFFFFRFVSPLRRALPTPSAEIRAIAAYAMIFSLIRHFA